MQAYHTQILRASRAEGLGSQYERIVLADLLPSLIKKLPIKSIVEYPATITHGYDNYAFLTRYQVTIVSDQPAKAKKRWPFLGSKLPHFMTQQQLLGAKNKHDLVWNFALFHQDESLFKHLDQVSRKYALVFTPNALNWGAPLHWGLHLLTMTKCNHPEHGPLHLMTKWGLAKSFEQHGWKVIKTGYVDMPPWPDFAFSKTQLFSLFPFSLIFQKAGTSKTPATANVFATIQKSATWERAGIPIWLQPLLAHHQYVLVEKI